jgi:hypothetical protein
MNGFGLAVALEEPNYSLDTGTYDEYYDAYSSMPDIVAALTFSNATFQAKISFVYSDFLTRDYQVFPDGGAGWAVAGGVVIKLDSMAPGDALLLKAAYGTALPYILGGGFAFHGDHDIWPGQTAWSLMGSFKHYFAPNFYASITGNYANARDWWTGGRLSSWQAEFDVSYSPAPTLWITPAIRWVSYTDPNTPSDSFSSWMATIRVQKVLF